MRILLEQKKLLLLKNGKFLLFVILIITFFIRLYSIDYGLPYVVGPDETRQILDTFSMGARLSLEPLEYSYAALHKYLLLLIYGIFFISGKIFGVFPDRFVFASTFLLQPYIFYLVARIISVAIGSIIVFIVYKTGVKLYNIKVGLLAALFASLNFHLIQFSYWATSDVLVVLFSALTFLFIAGYLKNSGFNDAILASLCAGLAISSKLQGVFLVVPLVFAHIFTLRETRNPGKIILWSLLVFIMGSLIGNMAYILKSQGALSRIIEISGASQYGISSAPLFQHNFLSATLWYMKELIKQDGLIGFSYCLGIVCSILRFKKEDIVFISCVMVFLISLGLSSLRFVYYGTFLFPFFSVFAAAAFWQIEKIGKKFGKIIITILILAVVLSSVMEVLYVAYKRSQPDTREIAKIWIENNIPQNETIAMDWYALNVPLDSEIPFMFRTGNALEYYETLVPDIIKNSYKEFPNKKTYNIIPIIYEKESDFWPDKMPKEVITRARKNPYFNRLYRRFNFRSVEELKEKRVKYIVLSSYSYSHFLLDNDPDKTGLFNQYIKEDMLSNNRQSLSFNPAIKENMLYFLCKRARDLYLPILKLRLKDIRLVKEFRPDNKSLGPVIKIYELI